MARPISVKGDGPWAGYSRLNANDRGQRRLLKLENGYVSADGSEIRAMPGFACILDLSDINNANGYGHEHREVVKPIYRTSPGEIYQYRGIDGNNILSLRALAKPTHYHAFEQCHSELIVIGESRFREFPVTDLTGGTIAPTTVSRDVVTGRWLINFGVTLGVAGSATDLTGAGLNYTTIDSLIYCEGLRTADATVNQYLDANVNGKVHEINTLNVADFVLQTTANASVPTSLTAVTAGRVTRVLPNRSNTYDATNGTNPYDANYLNRPDDPDALTAWRVVGGLAFNDVEKQCLPAWVANRQRDIGDQTGTNIVDGIWLTGNPNRGISRREKRKLPFRVCPEPSSDRIILAAPEYGCMFQIPLRIPIDPQFPPSNPTAAGLAAPNNWLRDKPRALGIPKARLIVPSQQETATYVPPGRTGYYGVGQNFNAFSWLNSSLGSPSDVTEITYGTWQMRITYWDAATNEEGPPSEVAKITIASGGTVYDMISLMLHVMHPGYVMGECLATHMRIYLAEPTSDVFKLYMTAPIDYLAGGVTATAVVPPAEKLNYMYGSSDYGLPAPDSPSSDNHFFCSFAIPSHMMSATYENDLRDILPRNVNMPRGASAARMVRGVLLSGGARGNAGPHHSLWEAKGRIQTGSPGFTVNDSTELLVQTYGVDALDGSAMDGSPATSLLGIAGRTFPDAYQGIEVVAPELLPAGSERRTIDIVGNRDIWQLAMEGSNLYGYYLTRPVNNYEAWAERLRLVEEWSTEMRGAAVARDDIEPLNERDKPIYFLMPQGQLQIGDPGAPQFAAKSSIKIFDSTKGEDITAIGRMGSTAFVCSREETYTLAWYRSAIGEELNLLTSEHGCIAPNSMVEFDGGLAWLSERGPVAVTADGPEFVGVSIAEDFAGDDKRYLADSDGMMRHAWACHDQARGLVMWGLVTKHHAHTVDDEGVTYAFDTTTTTDEVLSRYPCDEVLVWSYRAKAFSTWRPPRELEILWMRPIRDELGNVRVSFLAADGRLYAFDDAFNDRNGAIDEYGYTDDSITGDATFPVTDSGSDSTTISFTGAKSLMDGDYGSLSTKNAGLYITSEQRIEILDADGYVIGRSAIVEATAITSVATGTTTVTMSTALTWPKDATVRIGPRPTMTLVSTFLDGFDDENIEINGVQLRYSLFGGGHANVRATLIKPEFVRSTRGNDVVTREVDAHRNSTDWSPIGRGRTDLADTARMTGQRATIPTRATGPEIAVKIEVTGSSQIRLQDLMLEVT